MTASASPFPEDNALDAAANAAVDDCATPEEMAMISADPTGAARVAELAAVARAIGSPVAVQDAGAAAQGLAAALAVFVRSEADAAPTTHLPEVGSRVVNLRPVAGAGPRRRYFPGLAAVAAAVVLLGGLGVTATVLRRQSQPRSEVTTAAPAAKSKLTDSAAGSVGEAQTEVATNPAEGAPSASADSKSPAVPLAGRVLKAPPGGLSPPVVDGGDLGNQDDLGAVARQATTGLDGNQLATFATPEVALPSEVSACAAADAARAARMVGTLSFRAVTIFQGTPAIVLVYTRPETAPGRLLLVLARADCALLATTSI